MSGLNRSVSLTLIANTDEAKAGLDEITAQADKLAAEPIEVDIIGATEEAQAQLESFDEIFAELGDTAKTVSEQVTAALDPVDAELAALKAEMGLTDESFAALAESADVLKGQLAEVASGGGDLAAQLAVLGDEAKAVAELEADLSAAGETNVGVLKAQASAARAYAASLSILDDAQASLKNETIEADVAEASAAKEAEAAQASQAAAFEALGTAAKFAFLGIAAGAAYGTVTAVDFNQQLERIHTQAGVAQSQLSSLGSGVEALSGQVGFSPTSLVEALYHVESSFSSVGIKGPQALSLLQTAAEGAQVGGSDLTDTVNALDATMAANLPGINNYSQAMGALNAIVGAGDMTMEDLSKALGTGLMAVASSYGQSISQVGSALALFGDNNIRGANAATELRMAWQAMQAPLATAGPTLQSIGLTMTSLSKTMTTKGMSYAIQEFIQHLEASKVPANEWGQYMTDIFGKKAGVGIGIMVDQFGRLQSKFPDLEKGASGFGAAWNAQSETVQQKFKDLEQGLVGLVTKEGSFFLPVTKDVLGALDDLINGLERGNPVALALASVIGIALAGIALGKLGSALRMSIDGFSGAWESGGKLVEKLGALVTGNEELAEATKGAAVAQEDLDVAEDANPLGIIIIAIVALVAIIVILVTHCKAFRDFWIDAWKDISAAFTVAFDFVKSHWELIGAILLGPIAVAALEIIKHWDDITHGAEVMYDDVVNFFKELPARILDVVGDLNHLLLSAGENIVDGLISGIESKFGELESIVEGLADKVLGPFKSVLGIFSPSTEFAALGGYIVQGLTNGISSSKQAAINESRQLGADVLSAASSVGRLSSAIGPLGSAGQTVASASGGATVVNANITVAGVVGDAGATGKQIAQTLNTYLRQTGQKPITT